MVFFRTLWDFLRDPSYRDLIVTTMIVLASGTVVYHYVEGWRWLDSLYFSFITLTTIGYGDFSPETDFGRIFTMVYVVFGIGIILAFVNTVFQHYDESRKKSKAK